MKKYYKFGEILLALREEYGEYKKILDELKDCVNIESENSDYYFTGRLSRNRYDNQDNINDRKIILFVQKKYNEILKKIQYLQYDWYSCFLYSAEFNVEKQGKDQYGLKYDSIFTPVDGKKYIPKIQIVDQQRFSELINELITGDLMQLKQGYFANNHDSISLEFDEVYLRSSLGDESSISWKGVRDNLDYSINRHNSPMMISDILSLEIPADKISQDWLNLMEKHDNLFDKDMFFDVDAKTLSKKGILEISSIKKNDNKCVVKLLKK